jgi:predicted nucleotidyltransferase
MAKIRTRDIEKQLETFAADVERAAGANLVSLVLYGSGARGTLGPRSDVNLLLVLEDASAERMRPLGDPIREWVKSGERPPLIFSERSWRASADVFPLEIEDIRQHHRVVRGRNPVEGLETSRGDLRRELEREARGKLIQLRTAYLGAAADGKALGSVVSASLKTFLVLFRAALRLAGKTPPADSSKLAHEAATLTGLEIEALDWPLATLAGDSVPDLAPYDPRAARYLDAILAFVDYVDRA